MGSPSSPPLTVEESDGTNSNRPVTDLKFNAADFTIAASGRSSTVSLSGSGAGASLTDTYVGFGDASNLLTGSANFLFTQGSNQQLEINQASTAGLSTLAFKEAGTTAGIFQYRGSTNGTLPNSIRMGTNVSGGNIAFVTDSATTRMYIDSTGNVGIGTTSPSTPLHVKGTTTGSFLLLENVDTGNSSAPDLVLYRNSTSPAVGDFIGIIDFKGKDDGGNEKYYGRIGARIKDASSGSEDGQLFFMPAKSGSTDVANAALKLDAEDGAVFNEGGQAELDFRVESDAYQNMFFLDAGFNKIFMGNGSVENDADLGLVQISVGNSTQTALSLISTDADATSAPTLQFWRNSSTPTAGDQLGIIEFKGEDAAGTRVLYASINSQIDSTATGNHFSSIQFKVLQNGLERDNLRIRNSEVVVNEDSIDCNFRVEGVGTQNLISADAAQNNVGIGGSPSSDVEVLEIIGTGASNPMVRIRSTEAGASSSPELALYRNRTGAVNDDAASIKFEWDNDADEKINGAEIYAEIQTATDGAESNRLRFYNMFAGTQKEWMRVSNNGVEINAFSQNIDFTVEGDTTGFILFKCDASEDRIGIGANPTTGIADNEPILQVSGSVSSKCAIVTKTSATVDLSTRDSNELIGQLYVLTSTSAKTLTVPTTCIQGDWFRVLTTGANGMDIVASSGATLNGAVPATLTRDAQNEIYTVVAVATNKWICTSG
jgi:hypothetical protein